MKRIILAALAMLTLSPLTACADTGSSPSQADIDATVEARVAKALRASGSTPTIMPKSASSTPPSGRIVFHSSYPEGKTDIYMMNADGSGLTNLTQSSAWDSGASWSPDGSRIAFDSERSGDWDIYLMNADGTGITNITNQPGNQGGAVWSPDGTKIAFSSDQDGDRDIYLMNADGSRLLQITDNDADDYPSDWKP